MKCGYFEMRNDRIRKEKQPYCGVTKAYYGGCEGRLEECSLPTFSKVKKYVAGSFVDAFIEILRPSITPETRSQILRDFKGFGNKQAWREYLEGHDNIAILAQMDKMLHDFVKEQKMDYPTYARAVMSFDKLLDEWMPTFIRFEGKPNP